MHAKKLSDSAGTTTAASNKGATESTIGVSPAEKGSNSKKNTSSTGSGNFKNITPDKGKTKLGTHTDGGSANKNRGGGSASSSSSK